MSEVPDSVTTTPASSAEGVMIVAETPAQEPEATVCGLSGAMAPQGPARSMTDDELAWLLELENPNPPRPLPVDPAGDHWREQPESENDAPHLAEPGDVQLDHSQSGNGRAIAPPDPGTDDADSVTATAAGTTG